MTRILLPMLLLSMSALAFAQPPDGRRGPPPEALEACADQDADTRCAFTGDRGAVEGTCRVVPDGQLACVPDGHRPPPRR